MHKVLLIGSAILVGALIWRVGIGTLRSLTASDVDRTKPEVEDVEELDVFLVCGECGTEYQVTRLGELQIPRHCGEPMQVIRRPVAR
ncbi:MAG: hypothetical protein ABI869_02680 [Actinomycetota bacterium]